AGGDVVGVPVSLSDRSTGAGANVLMGLAVLVLAAVTLLPPLLSRRLRGAGVRPGDPR
ncbi:MAG: hypothetical protein H7323_00245, partial [Frankiales bacterium]|nr:hypothetical protein [Frankiales bacterium]